MNKQTEDKILQMLLHIHEKRIGGHPLDPQPDGVQWWIKHCGGSRLMRLQISYTGLDAYFAEESGLEFGHMDILPCKHLIRFFFFLKHTPPYGTAHVLLGAKGCSGDAWWGNVHRVRSYLNGVVAEIRWVERLSEWFHVPHFPYFATHYVDNISIACIGGILCDVLFNPKFAGCVSKVTVAIDSLGNIVWISHLGLRGAQKGKGTLYGL